MKFAPVWVIPEQKRSTTPDMFISDQYGKLPGPNNDGSYYLDQEVRMSYIVDGYTPAFKDNDSVIYGLYVDKRPDRTYLKGSDLVFKINMGTGIINNRVFVIPNHIVSVWKNFGNDIPVGIPKGKALIYLAHKEAYVNDPERPYRRSSPPREGNETLPHDQSGFNGIDLCGAWFDPYVNTPSASSNWDYFEHKILLVGTLWYEKNFSTGEVRIWWDDDRNEIVITTPEGPEILKIEDGDQNLEIVDGGPLEDITLNVSDRPNAFLTLYEGLTSRFNDTFSIPVKVTNFIETYCFFNGVLYRPNDDYIIDPTTNVLSFTRNVIVPNRQILFYQNTTRTPNGYLEIMFDNVVPTSTTNMSVTGLLATDKCIVHVNGVALPSSEYVVTTNRITFLTPIKSGLWVRITRIVEGSGASSYVKLYHMGLAKNGTSISIYGLSETRKYLVFYNGLLYTEKTDYSVSLNTLIFDSIIMDSKKDLIVLGV